MRLSPRLAHVEELPVRGALSRLLGTPGIAPGTVLVEWRSGPFTWAIRESATTAIHLPAFGDNAVHLLHAQDEDRARIDIDGAGFALKPGDSILYFDSESPIVSQGQLLVTLHVEDASERRDREATHGRESFTGYNRRTTYDLTPNLGFDRWKLTQPLRLTSADPCPVLAIYGIIGIVEGTQVYTLHAGESMVFEGTIDLLPDGLAYCMTMWDEKAGDGPVAQSYRA